MRRFVHNPEERELEFNPYRPNEEAWVIAQDYMSLNHWPALEALPYVKVDVAQAKKIAKAFAETPDQPDNPFVREAYADMAEEVENQFDFLPVRITPYGDVDGEPYASSPEMMEDIFQNGHMFVYNGGDDHSLLSREQNWMFRAVHDYFGHALGGFAFGPRGEENAWMSHCRMFSPLARSAMTTETRGQNSWVNYGPNSHLPVTERPFADQKVLILPEKYLSTPVLCEAYAQWADWFPSCLRAVN